MYSCWSGSDGHFTSGFIIIQGLLRETSLKDLRAQNVKGGVFDLVPDVLGEDTFPRNNASTNLLNTTHTEVEGQTALFLLRIHSKEKRTQCLAL